MKTQDNIPKNQYCDNGMVFGICFDEYPPFRIWKAKHEVYLPEEDSTIYLCSYCLNLYYIDDDEKEEFTDYDLTHIDKEALEKWNNEYDKRLMKRAEYLERGKKQ